MTGIESSFFKNYFREMDDVLGEFGSLKMVLLIGQPINGRDLEQATSPWSPERFASMCDALAWAASGRQGPGLPSFTTRVNAKDGGVDAEWWVQLPDNH
jgi:hypothetical protein